MSGVESIEPKIHQAMSADCTRRTFIACLSAGIAGVFLPEGALNASISTPHPTPRRGITGAHVLAAADLDGNPELIKLFDGVRRIPHVIDGIRCNCGCGNPPEFYSLLSCYEKNGMAKECAVCQGQGKLAVRLHQEGKTLQQIRVAVDAKFG